MKNSRSGKAFIIGLGILLFVNVSFVFLLAGPYIENPLGRRLDKRLLADIDQAIESVRKGTFTIIIRYPDGEPVRSREIIYRQTGHDFLFGCNIFGFDQFDDPAENELYKNYFKNLFNTAVLPFYWSQNEPEKGKLVRTQLLNDILDWCEKNNITTKGHPLAWRNPAGYPDWLPEDDDLVVELLKARIQNSIQKYGDRIKIWDVVNEPTHLPAFGNQSTFDYVFNALVWAHEKDPQSFLTVNDYGIMGHDFGNGPYARLIDKLLKARAPLSCIGLQGHEPRTDWIPAVELKATLDAFSRFGLPIHITEITIPSSNQLPITNSWKKGVWSENNQAEYLERFYKVCFSHPSVEGIIHWDLYDGHSWVKNGGLIRVFWEPKPAYERLSYLINHEWRTEGKGVTDEKGEIKFSGFFGTYEIQIPEAGKKFDINAKREGDKEFRLTLTRD